jgi:hypothetical protein
MDEIINRVAQSALVSFDLEELYPAGKRVVYDLKDNLFQGLILKEKDFRTFLRAHDWSAYAGCHVAVTCSVEAILPTWAYMLVALHLEPHATTIVHGDMEALESTLFRKLIDGLDVEVWRDKKVVVKGCSKLPVHISAYTHLAYRLRPVVASLMFGEPCSTVPLYKNATKSGIQ